MRCQTRRVRQKAATRAAKPQQPLAKKYPAYRGQASEKRPLSFRIYDLDTSNDLPDSREAPTNGIGQPAGSLSLQHERLEFESDIGHTNDIGSRLVDNPDRQQDFSLWAELLQYRQRHYGHHGTLDIFRGLVDRMDGIYLPTEGEPADFLWRSFIDVGLEREDILYRLEDYAATVWKKRGKRWGKFYECVVGGFLDRGLPDHANKWHDKLQNPHLGRPNDILRVLEPALSLPRAPAPAWVKGKRRPLSPGIQAFQNIFLSTKGCDLYGPVISTLLQHGYTEDALTMHAFLVDQRQHPHNYTDMYPLLEYTNKYGLWNDFQDLKQYANERFPVKADVDDGEPTNKEPTTRAATLLTATHPKKPFKDDLGARFFATAALKFDTVVSGLAMFGVAEIGPLSLREMAVRSHGSRDIHDKFQKFQKARISVGDSVYARLLRRLAAENRDILLSDLVRSDQHPDVLEDAQMQEYLLVSNYMAQDWRQYNLTLAILGELLRDGPELSNIHFRKYVASGELDLAAKLVDEMALGNESLSKRSIDFMVKRLLSVRRPGKGPNPQPGSNPLEGVGFAIRILQRVAQACQYIPPELWIELLRRLGMANRFDTLRKSCVWVSRHYSSLAKYSSDRGTSHSREQSESTHGLSRDGAYRTCLSIFNPEMQAAIVTWGFKMRVSQDPDKAYNLLGVEGGRLIPWTRGLILLRELEKEGVSLDVARIRQTTRQRLATLFGRVRWSVRPLNRLLRRENPYSLRDLLTDIDRAWGESLFGGREISDLHGLINPPNARVKELKRRKRKALREVSEARDRVSP